METLIVIMIKQDSQKKQKAQTIAERDYQQHNKNRNLNYTSFNFIRPISD